MAKQGNYQFFKTQSGGRSLRMHVHPAYVAMQWAKGDKDRAIGWIERRMYQAAESKGINLPASTQSELAEAIAIIRDGREIVDKAGNPIRGRV